MVGAGHMHEQVEADPPFLARCSDCTWSLWCHQKQAIVVPRTPNQSRGSCQCSPAGERHPSGKRPGRWPFFKALFCLLPVLAAGCAVHPIYVELRERTEANMLKVTRYSIILTTVIYFFTAIAGYLLFGPYTDSDLLVNFDKAPFEFVDSEAVFDVVRVSYVLHIILVFPVIFYSLRHITDDLVFPSAPKALIEDNKRFFGITALYLLLIYLFAGVVPNIWVAFTITGATTTMVVGMVFPALLALRCACGAPLACSHTSPSRVLPGTLTVLARHSRDSAGSCLLSDVPL